MAYVRNPILILKDARRAIIQTLLVCQMYANSPGAEFLIHYRRLFFHLHAYSMAWTSGKNTTRHEFSPCMSWSKWKCVITERHTGSSLLLYTVIRAISTRKLKFFKSENDLAALTYAEQISTLLWGPVRGKFRQATRPWTGGMRATKLRRPTDYCNELAKATPMSRLSDSEFGNWQNCECPAEHLRVHYSVVTTE